MISDSQKKIIYELRNYVKSIQNPPSGEYFFLECNPNGQWLWVELETDLPISRAIAEFLSEVKI